MRLRVGGGPSDQLRYWSSSQESEAGGERKRGKERRDGVGEWMQEGREKGKEAKEV